MKSPEIQKCKCGALFFRDFTRDGRWYPYRPGVYGFCTCAEKKGGEEEHAGCSS